MTVTRDALDLTIEGLPPPSPGPLLYRDPLAVTLLAKPAELFKLVHLRTSGGQDLRLVQMCSLEDPPRPPVLTSSGYCTTYGGRAGVCTLHEYFLVDLAS